MSDLTKWTLIERAARGDEVARVEFTRCYLPSVRAYLFARWKNRLSADALEDAVQEVFVECLKESGVLENAQREGKGDFRALLFAVARNVALREESRRARQKDAPSDQTFHGDLFESDEATYSRIFDRAWAQAIMKEARALQGARAQLMGTEAVTRVELLRLRFQVGSPIRDIARLWKVDSERLHRQYKRAVGEFEQALRDVVASQNPGSAEVVDRACREFLALLA